MSRIPYSNNRSCVHCDGQAYMMWNEYDHTGVVNGKVYTMVEKTRYDFTRNHNRLIKAGYRVPTRYYQVAEQEGQEVMVVFYAYNDFLEA